MEWKDTTSYLREDKMRIPTTWTATPHPDLRITVICSHIDYKGQWVMHCAPWYNTFPLGKDITSTKQAQNRALELVRQKVRSLAAALETRERLP